MGRVVVVSAAPTVEQLLGLVGELSARVEEQARVMMGPAFSGQLFDG